MFFVGIDWSDAKHDICVLNASGEIVREFQIENTAAGFDILRKRFHRLGW